MRATPVILAILALPLLSAAAPAERAERDRMMVDYGAALRRADAARARGEYQTAVDELNGYLTRWRDRGLDGVDADVVLAKMAEYVALRELLERAAMDDAAAARYLSAVVKHADPSGKVVEQARALGILAKHNPRLAALLGRAFPARLVISVDTPPDFPPDHHQTLLENALTDLTRDQPLRLFDDAGKGTLTVLVTVRQNDARNSLLEGTAMKSCAMHAVMELSDEAGAVVCKSAMTSAMLGINPGNAAAYGMSSMANRIYSAIIDELVRRVDRGDLP